VKVQKVVYKKEDGFSEEGGGRSLQRGGKEVGASHSLRQGYNRKSVRTSGGPYRGVMESNLSFQGVIEGESKEGNWKALLWCARIGSGPTRGLHTVAGGGGGEVYLPSSPVKELIKKVKRGTVTYFKKGRQNFAIEEGRKPSVDVSLRNLAKLNERGGGRKNPLPRKREIWLARGQNGGRTLCENEEDFQLRSLQGEKG